MALPATGGDVRALTSHNAERLAQLDLPKAEHFTFAGAGGTSVHAMLLKPPSFDASKKYPLLMVLHGGPETQFGDTWSFRWNNQTLASPGYAVLMINRRGSTGFGQQFTDDINNDWGGKAYEDLMKGLDATLAKYAFLDGTRVAAAGASYGGYMIGWMASQSKGRFKTLVCHAGVYDLPSMYGATEEVWFAEWSFKGTPWANPDNFLRQSPHAKAADFGTFKTPTLVIHGELDFRVPYTQGLEFYTALQRQGVPSRLVVFPDEGHWILKPQNSAFWYTEVHGVAEEVSLGTAELKFRAYCYCFRSAATGLTRVARRAGHSVAWSPTTISTAATAANDSGSHGETFQISSRIARAASAEPASPMTMPAAMSFAPPASTIETMRSVVAPSAIRTPISCVRRLTACAMTP